MTAEVDWWCVHLTDNKTEAVDLIGNTSGRAGFEALAGSKNGILTLTPLAAFLTLL